jgi:hypothetical protein
MTDKVQIKKDCELLDIENIETISIRFVTAKYKRRARIVHPDKKDGNTGDFQELLHAYRRIIKFLENRQEGELDETEEDHEKDFFMKHNFTKEFSNSCVVYIGDRLASK